MRFRLTLTSAESRRLIARCSEVARGSGCPENAYIIVAGGINAFVLQELLGSRT